MLGAWRSSGKARPSEAVQISTINTSSPVPVPCWSSWKMGMSHMSLSRSSISKHSGAGLQENRWAVSGRRRRLRGDKRPLSPLDAPLMSSRLMPPKVPAMRATVLINSSGSVSSTWWEGRGYTCLRAWLGERAWPRRVRASRLNSGAMHDGIQPRRSVASRKLGEPHTGKSATRSEPDGPGRKHVEGQRTSSSGRQRPGRRRPRAPLTSTSKESTPPKCLSSTALPSMTGLLAMAPTGRTQGAAGRTCEGERRARPPEGSREEAMTSPLLLLPFKERFLRSRHVSRALLPLSFQKRHRKVQKAAVVAAHAALHRQRETRSARGANGGKDNA